MKKNPSKKTRIPGEKETKPKPANNVFPQSGDDAELLAQIIFSSLIDGILLVSRELKVLRGNLAAEEMFRRSFDSFKERPLSELFPGQPAVGATVQKIFATGSSYRDVESLGYRKSNGSSFPVSLTLSPFLDSQGAVCAVVILVKDVSLLKELQESARQVDQMAAMGTLALGLAHEIRNPLGGIRGSAQLLRNELTHSEHKEYLEVVISEVDRIDRIVKRAIDFNKPGKLVFADTNIHKALQEICVLEKETIQRKNSAFEQIYDPSLPPIQADADQLKQVFLNLIKNAIDASPKGEKVRLVTRFSSGYSVKNSPNSKSRQYIVVEVTDFGEGMEEKQLENLFTPFYTTKSKGSGLGMPISLKIVENHNGKIRVISEKNAGTTVQVFLPIHQK